MTVMHINLYDANLITGSSDLVRQALHGFYEPTEILEASGSVTLVYSAPSTSDPGSFEGAKEDLINSVTLAQDTNLVIKTSSVSMFPHYIVPVSLEGALDYTEGTVRQNADTKWRAYIMGGVYNQTTYPGIYINEAFDVNNFSFDLPYDKLTIKTIDPDSWSSYQYLDSRSAYNAYIPRFQEYTSVNPEHKILNIYDVVLAETHGTLEDGGKVVDEVSDRVSLDDEYELGTSAGKIFIDGFSEFPALVKTSEEAGSLATSDLEYNDPYVAAYQYFLDYAIFQEEGTPSSNGYFSYGDSTLLIDKNAISDTFYSVATKLNHLPYYNAIQLPKFSADKLNSIIVKNNFSPLLLKSIKDAFVDNLYALGENNFTMDAALTEINDVGKPFEFNRVANKSFSYVDFTEILRSVSNFPIRSPGSVGERFIGGVTLEQRAAIDYQGTFRHINKQRNWEVLREFQRGVFSLAPAAGSIVTDSSTYMPWSDLGELSMNSFLDLANGELNDKSECVAIRIEKQNINDESTTNIIIQNQPVESTSDGTFDKSTVHSQDWTYYDTQVKYGVPYQYTTYGYFMVVGYKYTYTDITLSRRISSYQQYEWETFTEGLIAAGVPASMILPLSDYLESEDDSYTCIEFYDPSTDITKYPTMRIDIANPLEPRRLPLITAAGDYRFTISEDYATPAQNLAHGDSINWADFNLKIEPIVRIFEVPLARKVLTVLDNPPPRIDITPYQVKDQSQAIGFFARLENPPIGDDKNRFVKYPTPINELEMIEYVRYLTSQNLLSTDDLSKGSVSRPNKVQIYRLNHKPESMSDFNRNLVATKSLNLIEGDLALVLGYSNHGSIYRTEISTTCFYEERIATDHKFYYAFRLVNENGTPGIWSPVIEAELIDDGGYKYAVFNNIMENELGQGLKYENTSEQFKKLFTLKPNISQMAMNISDLNYEDEIAESIDLLTVGEKATENIWDKTFKIRLTSKKTGKKIDLNVTYNLKPHE